MAFVIGTKNLTFTQWANRLQSDFPTANIPVATSDDKWREWVKSLYANSTFGDIPLPERQSKHSKSVQSWQDWANAFINTMYNK